MPACLRPFALRHEHRCSVDPRWIDRLRRSGRRHESLHFFHMCGFGDRSMWIWLVPVGPLDFGLGMVVSASLEQQRLFLSRNPRPRPRPVYGNLSPGRGVASDDEGSESHAHDQRQDGRDDRPEPRRCDGTPVVGSRQAAPRFRWTRRSMEPRSCVAAVTSAVSSFWRSANNARSTVRIDSTTSWADAAGPSGPCRATASQARRAGPDFGVDVPQRARAV